MRGYRIYQEPIDIEWFEKVEFLAADALLGFATVYCVPDLKSDYAIMQWD